MKQVLHGFILSGLMLASGQSVAAGMESDPWINHVMVERLEWQEGGDTAWEGRLVSGYDHYKLEFSSEGGLEEGELGELQYRFLYRQALTPWWDGHVGYQRDRSIEDSRDWFALGFQGTAPFMVEVDGTVLFRQGGQAGFELSLEKEFMLTQRLVLIPEIEGHWYRRDDETMERGSGLAEASFGIRLAYEIRREFSPYIGIQYQRHYGDTASYAREHGESIDSLKWVAGIRIWF